MAEQLHPLAQRSAFWYGLLQRATGVAISLKYNIDLQNGERLLPYKHEPFFLLPKHQSIVDIILEGKILRNFLNRPAYYVMKSETLDFYKLLGGIKITRPKDLALEKTREAIRRARDQRDQVFDCVKQVYDAGEIVVIHPEGERHYKQSAPLNHAILMHLLKLQTKKEKIFVPLSIEYEEVNKFRSKIIATLGNPLRTNSILDLEEHLIKEINLVSRK